MGLCLTGTAADVADVVFLTNDSLNVEWVAENLFDNVFFYNEIRNMKGCTGDYKGTRVTFQGEGIGPVNAAMYAVEIAGEFDPKILVKVDCCKTMRSDVPVGTVILPQTAHTTSNINKRRFGGMTFPAAADFELLNKIYEAALAKKMDVKVGPVLSIEHRGELEIAKKFTERGALALDMEMNQTFTAGQRFHKPCAGVLLVTENLETGEKMSKEEAEKAYHDLIAFALDTVLEV